MSNSSPIRTASTSRFTLSTFTLRTDATTYFPPGDDSRQVCKLSIIALVGQHFPVHLFQAMNCGPDRPCCMDHPEGCLIIVFFNTGDNLDAT